MYNFIKILSLKRKTSSDDEILDFIYDTLDDLLLENKFEEVDQILKNIYVDELTDIELVGILTITFPHKNSLKLRSTLFNKAKIKIDHKILKGLE